MGPVAPRRGLGLAAIADDHAACAFHLQFHGRFTGILSFVGTVTVGFICRFATGTIILGTGRFIDIVRAFLIGHEISLSEFGIQTRGAVGRGPDFKKIHYGVFPLLKQDPSKQFWKGFHENSDHRRHRVYRPAGGSLFARAGTRYRGVDPRSENGAGASARRLSAV